MLYSLLSFAQLDRLRYCMLHLLLGLTLTQFLGLSFRPYIAPAFRTHPDISSGPFYVFLVSFSFHFLRMVLPLFSHSSQVRRSFCYTLLSHCLLDTFLVRGSRIVRVRAFCGSYSRKMNTRISFLPRSRGFWFAFTTNKVFFASYWALSFSWFGTRTCTATRAINAQVWAWTLLVHAAPFWFASTCAVFSRRGLAHLPLDRFGTRRVFTQNRTCFMGVFFLDSCAAPARSYGFTWTHGLRIALSRGYRFRSLLPVS